MEAQRKRARGAVLALAIVALAAVDASALDVNLIVNYSNQARAGEQETYEGLQLSCMVNVVNGELDGAQVGLVCNWATEDAAFLQLGGIANVAAGDYQGTQAGPFLNWVGGTVSGLQLGGVANVAGGAVSGTQASCAYNAAASVSGFQLSGVVNRSGGRVDGVQLACLLNVAGDVRGWQIGVVNIADSLDGHAIGVVSVERDGIADLGAFIASDGGIGIEGRLGTKRTYTALAVDATVLGDDSRACLYLGFGRRFRFCSVVLDADLGIAQRASLPLGPGSVDSCSRIALARVAIPLSDGPLYVGGGVGLKIYDADGGWIDPAAPWGRITASVRAGLRLGRPYAFLNSSLPTGSAAQTPWSTATAPSTMT